MGGQDRLGDRPVVRQAEDGDDIGAGLGRYLDLEAADVHGLHVGHKHVAGERLLENAQRL